MSSTLQENQFYGNGLNQLCMQFHHQRVMGGDWPELSVAAWRRGGTSEMPHPCFLFPLDRKFSYFTSDNTMTDGQHNNKTIPGQPSGTVFFTYRIWK